MFILRSSPGRSDSKIVLYCVISILLVSSPLHSQMDTLIVPGDTPTVTGKLNTVIDSLTEKGTLSRTILLLENNSRYILDSTIVVPRGEKLTIIAPATGNSRETAPPQILWSDWRLITGNNRSEFMIEVFGDLELKNLWIYFADTTGVRLGTPIVFDGDSITESQDIGIFENCIFESMPCPWVTASGVICVRSEHFNGKFSNCYFRNCTDDHYKYYGRAVSFPYDSFGWHIDSLSFENCTFANMGYVYSQERSYTENIGNYADYVNFNHCTFANIMMFSLQSGWWYKASVTNSLWVNGFMAGHQSAYYPIYGGTMEICPVDSFGFDVPFEEQERKIIFANNSYHVKNWLTDWLANNDFSQELRDYGLEDQIPEPQPMLNDATIQVFASDSFPYMNSANLYDSTNPDFIIPATHANAIKEFLYYGWASSLDTSWSYQPNIARDYLWPLPENLAYTNDTLLTAGMGEFPLGDLYHWFPDEYTEWESQQDNEHTRISNWLETGKDSIITAIDEENQQLAEQFQLFQNYPNPFNPSTMINYQLAITNDVQLDIYNTLGEKVASLVSEKQQAGNYSAQWNADDFASGVYFYQIKVGNHIKSRKMLLLK